MDARGRDHRWLIESRTVRNADRVYVLEHARIIWEGDPDRFAAESGAGYL